MLRSIARLTPTYLQTRKKIRSGTASCSESYIQKCIKLVSFYGSSKSYSKDSGAIPILRKRDIIGKEEQFVSSRFFKPLLNKFSTGGTSGVSLNMYRSYRDIIREWAFVDHAFSLIGNNLKVAVLRGKKPQEEIYELKNGKLILSSYAISAETIVLYIQMLKKHSINCIHAYPSSLMILCKCIETMQLTDELNNIEGTLCSSEIFTLEDKRLVKSVFPNAKLIDLYGQNEHVAFAISEDFGPYNFYPNYGKTEFIKRNDISQTIEGLEIKEIVSTGFINQAMPLLRYGTEDFAAIDRNGNVVSIIGRTQDYLFDNSKQKLPCTVITRPNALKNVLSFQFLQTEYGKMTFCILTNKDFTNHEAEIIKEDIEKHYNRRIETEVKICDKLVRSKRGKLIRLIQKLENN